VRLSIVIPTMNRLAALRMVIEGLLQQTFPAEQFEVIVVSDGSTDGTARYLTGLQTPFRVVPVLQTNQGAADARNAGIQRAQGDYIVFLDDDTVPAADFLEVHARMQHSHGEKAVILGPMLPPPSGWQPSPWVSWELSTLAEQYQSMLNGEWDATPRQFYTANASVLRRRLLEVGGFDPRFRRAEDVELAYRLDKAGAEFVYAPEALVYHYAERSFASWASIPYAYGKNDVVFCLQNGQSWLLPTVYREFHRRHPLIRALVKGCLDRALLSRTLTVLMKQAAQIFFSLGLSRASDLACSAIFNLRYYQGIADALGSRQAFFSGVHQNLPSMQDSSLSTS
jgi:GT2 family glycosyltransferase